MTNAVTYCRVSSDEQAQKDLSIPAQRKALVRWIEEQSDIQLAEEFVDEGESAYAPADKRPGFCQMIAYCRKNDVGFILVHKLDRFSRNREESILFKSLLRKHGVQVKSITENFDPETPQGFLYEGMIEVINQFYSMNLATETMKGMRENAERGYHNGGRSPYGYRVEKTPDANGREHSRLVPGPAEEVAVVREIFRLALEENRGARGIARLLNERGVPAPLGPHWSLSSVGTMLASRVYVGDSVWNKRNAKTARNKNKDAWIIVPDTHEPLIDRAVFDKRQELAQQRTFVKRSSPRRSVTYLLGRLVVCDHCGSAFVGRRQKIRADNGEEREYFRYYCNGYIMKGRAVCDPIAIQCEWLEDEVIRLIGREICTSQRLAALKDLVREKIEARRAHYSIDARGLQRKLADVDRRIQHYFRAIGEGIDPTVCRGHIDKLKVEKAEIQKEADILRQDDYYRRALETNVAELERFAAVFKRGFYGLPFATQRQVILHFIEEIRVVDREVVRIKVKVPFDEGGIRHLTDEILSIQHGDGSGPSRAQNAAGFAGFGDRKGAAPGARRGAPPTGWGFLVYRGLGAPISGKTQGFAGVCAARRSAGRLSWLRQRAPARPRSRRLGPISALTRPRMGESGPAYLTRGPPRKPANRKMFNRQSNGLRDSKAAAGRASSVVGPSC